MTARLVRLALALVVGCCFASCGSLRASAISGRVLDLSQEPVAGAYLELRNVDHAALDEIDTSRPAFATGVTDGDGEYGFGGLTHGTWLLTVVASEGESAAESLAAWVAPSADATRPPDIGVSRYLWRIAPGTNVLGRSDSSSSADANWIRDLAVPVRADGETEHLTGRLGGAFDPDTFLYEVRWQVGDMNSPNVATVPDSEGRFDLGHVPMSKRRSPRVRIQPRTPDACATPGTLALVRDESAPDDELVLLVPELRVIEMVVTPPPGEELLDPSVSLATTQPREPRYRDWLTTIWPLRGDVPFRVSTLVAVGSYFVNARAAGLGPESVTVDVGGEGLVQRVELRLVRYPNARVRFVDEHGNPVQVVSVDLYIPHAGQSSSALQQLIGRASEEFDLGGLRPGSYRIKVITGRARRFSETFTLEREGDSVEVLLDHGSASE